MKIEYIKTKKVFVNGQKTAVKVTLVSTSIQELSIEQEAKLLKFLETL